MRALVLAAGLGTRLRPLTDTMPKSMVPVGGIPVLERNVAWLCRNGVTEIAINLHHRADAVTSHFGDGSAFGVAIRWSPEGTLLGTAGALGPLREWLGSDTFLVLYGDNLIDIDMERFRELHERAGATATVALFERADVSASGVAEVEGDLVVRFVEKPAPGETSSRLVSAGLILCEPSVHASVGPPPSDFGRDVLPALLAGGEPVAGYRMRPGETLRWIDTYDDLERAERELAVEAPS